MLDNRKTRYTRRVIKESYCEILAKKHISKITIKELCELADINKGTFYNHYYNIYALHEELENEIIGFIKEAIEKGDYSTQNETGYAILRIMYEHKDVLHSMVISSSDGSFWNKLSDVMTSKSIWMWEDTDTPCETIMMATKYILTISNAIHREWIMNGYKEPIEVIHKICLAILEKIEDLFFETG